MTPDWLPIAEKYIGTKEIPGPKSNPTILGFAKRIGGWVASLVKTDETPWCGTFMASIMREWRPFIGLPKNPLSALAWALWGRNLLVPTLGAVLVFKRPGGGHVGLYKGEDDKCYHVLGGNQGDAVSVIRILKSRCVAIRWPLDYPMPTPERVWVEAKGQVSTNEA